MLRGALPVAIVLALAAVLVGCGGSDRVAAPAAEAAPALEADAAQAAQADAAPAPDDVSRGSAPPAPAPAPAANAAEAALSATDVTVWVTRDAGADLLRAEEVKPGLTAVQALEAAAEIETRYGGRFVTSIDGLEGDADGQIDWFFLINGIEPDVGAAEVKVEAGDLVWWDRRSWIDDAGHPAIAIGAFPRPFHRGWKGVVRPVSVVGPAALAATAAELEMFLGMNAPDDPKAKPHAFELVLRTDADGAELSASMGSGNGSAVRFVLAGNEAAIRAAATALMARPEIIARRYDARFNDAGEVLEP